MTNLLLLIITFIIALCLDSLWLMLFGAKLYGKFLGFITRRVNGVPTPIYSLLLLCYLLVAIGIVFLVLPKAHGHLSLAFFWGAIFGCIVTGVYSLTNSATIQNWPAVITVLDIVMNFFVCGITSLVVAWIAIQWLQ